MNIGKYRDNLKLCGFKLGLVMTTFGLGGGGGGHNIRLQFFKGNNEGKKSLNIF